MISFKKKTCILPLQSLADFQRSLLIMKSIYDKVLQYIKTLFTLCPNCSDRFRLPLPRLDRFKSHSISFSAVMSWNFYLLNNFKRKLSNYLKRKLGNHLLKVIGDQITVCHRQKFIGVCSVYERKQT